MLAQFKAKKKYQRPLFLTLLSGALMVFAGGTGFIHWRCTGTIWIGVVAAVAVFVAAFLGWKCSSYQGSGPMNFYMACFVIFGIGGSALEVWIITAGDTVFTVLALVVMFGSAFIGILLQMFWDGD